MTHRCKIWLMEGYVSHTPERERERASGGRFFPFLSPLSPSSLSVAVHLDLSMERVTVKDPP